jgi:hypothetical protein
MSEDDVQAYVRAAAALADLALGEDSLTAVVANTRILRAMYAEFADLDLPDELDPAAVLTL